MLKLIGLDIRKYRLKRQFLYFILANLCMAVVIFGILSNDAITFTDSAPRKCPHRSRG